MSSRPEVLLIGGARPNFVKIAPVFAALRQDGGLEATLVHTGQHYDREMSDLFFDQLGLPEPAIQLRVGSGSHARQTAEIMIRLEPVIQERRPAAVIVVGDVNSTVASALVAVKENVPVAHVEAGLRSFDRSMPEEINRILTDAVSSWLFVSERSGLENLAREGVDGAKVHFVGNVMIDTLLRFRDRARALDVPGRLGLTPKAYAVLTLHRPANVDEPAVLLRRLGPILDLGRSLAVVFPIHPRTRAALARTTAAASGHLRLLDPLGYLEFLGLMMDAALVMTDSGGVQEETTVLGVPCVTLRENTERPVTIREGTNRLGGVEPDGIRKAIREALESPPRARMPELWDGKAAERIVGVLGDDLAG